MHILTVCICLFLIAKKKKLVEKVKCMLGMWGREPSMSPYANDRCRLLCLCIYTLVFYISFTL